jgi:hypothetical protein
LNLFVERLVTEFAVREIKNQLAPFKKTSERAVCSRRLPGGEKREASTQVEASLLTPKWVRSEHGLDGELDDARVADALA